MSVLRSPTMGLACCAALLFAASAGASELPLGPRSLDERRTRSAVAPDVTRTHIVRGRASHGGVAGPWRVDVLRVGRRKF